MTPKREAVLAAQEITSLAMDIGGGSTYRKGSLIERAHRDVMAGRFHPFDPDTTLVHGGRLALGLSSHPGRVDVSLPPRPPAGTCPQPIHPRRKTRS